MEDRSVSMVCFTITTRVLDYEWELLGRQAKQDLGVLLWRELPPGRVVKRRRVEWGRMAALRPTTRFSYGVQCAGSTTSASGSDENEDLFLSKPCSRF